MTHADLSNYRAPNLDRYNYNCKHPFLVSYFSRLKKKVISALWELLAIENMVSENIMKA